MKTIMQSLALIILVFCTATSHAAVITYENRTPYTAQITFRISDLAQDKSFAVEPHQQKQIDLGNTLPSSSKVEFLHKNTAIASVDLPPLKINNFSTDIISYFYFICDQPIDTNNRITPGKLMIYARTNSYIPNFFLAKETQPFAFPITSQEN